MLRNLRALRRLGARRPPAGPAAPRELRAAICTTALSSIGIGWALVQLNVETGDSNAIGTLNMSTTDVAVCSAMLFFTASFDALLCNGPTERCGRRISLLAADVLFVVGNARTPTRPPSAARPALPPARGAPQDPPAKQPSSDFGGPSDGSAQRGLPGADQLLSCLLARVADAPREGQQQRGRRR